MLIESDRVSLGLPTSTQARYASGQAMPNSTNGLGWDVTLKWAPIGLFSKLRPLSKFALHGPQTSLILN